MKKYLLLFLLVPAISATSVNAQGKVAEKSSDQSTAGNYVISGTITGYPDGTVVDLLNGNTGAPESTTTITGGKFVLSGKVEFPDFKLVSFNKQPQYIPIFLDNSKVTVSAKSDALDVAQVTGSPSHEDFKKFNEAIKPYQQLFTQEGAGNEAEKKKAADVTEAFARKNTHAFITPLAIFRNFQLTENSDLMEELFTKLPAQVQATPLGNYITQQIEEAKRNPIGKVLPDFTQNDINGKAISLSSFKGKYVLVDFWASWCGPCRVENPNVVNAYQKYKNKNFTVLGVSLDKAKDPWIKAIEKDNLNWVNVSDLKGWGNEVAQQFQIHSIPQNFLIDPQGRLIAKNLRGAALQAKLAELLK